MAKKLKNRYCVVNVDGSSRQRKFTLHKDLESAQGQARQLAEEFKNQRFMIMQTVGGIACEKDGFIEIEVSAGAEE